MIMATRATWNSITELSRATREFTSNLWNGWRWIAVGLAGFATWDASGQEAPFYFGIICSVIGVSTWAFWILELFAGSVTDEAMKFGRMGTVLMATFAFFLSIWLALGFAAVIASLAVTIFTN